MLARGRVRRTDKDPCSQEVRVLVGVIGDQCIREVVGPGVKSRGSGAGPYSVVRNGFSEEAVFEPRVEF